MSCEVQGEGRRSILPTKLVASATSLERSKKITSNRSSTAKIYKSCKFREDRSVNYEKIGLTKITKNIFKTTAKHKPSLPAFCAQRVG